MQDNRILAELDYPRTTGPTSITVGISSPNNHASSSVDCSLSGIGNIPSSSKVDETVGSALGVVSWSVPPRLSTNSQQSILPVISQVRKQNRSEKNCKSIEILQN